MPPIELPLPQPRRDEIVTWVGRHLGELCCDDVVGSPAFIGGQTAADEALSSLDITGYARSRSMVDPSSRRGASKMSPWIRHGLLSLPQVWDHVEDAPSYDRFRYQGELLWQDYARHWYALYGTATRSAVAYDPVHGSKEWPHKPWWRDMECLDQTLTELETDGWCVNQTRMWLASQYTVRGHGGWRDGEDHMFTHLLDGSRAANRLGWQWTVGGTRPKAHGFAKAQVKKRAPAYCEACSLQDSCPIGGYARTEAREKRERPPMLPFDYAYGPSDVTSSAAVEPEAVWLTAESLGDDDPALAAHPDLPVWFVFDEPLLRRLKLSSKRLVFLAECLADLSQRRDLTVWLGRPDEVIADTPVAVTFAPVPGFRRIAEDHDSLTAHPWPWLRPPTPDLLEYLDAKDRFPAFRNFCQLTKPESGESTDDTADTDGASTVAVDG